MNGYSHSPNVIYHHIYGPNVHTSPTMVPICVNSLLNHGFWGYWIQMGAEIHSGVSNSAVHNHVDLIIHDNKKCINMLVRVTFMIFMRFFFVTFMRIKVAYLYAISTQSGWYGTNVSRNIKITWNHRINTGFFWGDLHEDMVSEQWSSEIITIISNFDSFNRF